MVGGRYGVIRVSFSCCRLETDVCGITPPVSSLTHQPLLPSTDTHAEKVRKVSQRFQPFIQIKGE